MIWRVGLLVAMRQVDLQVVVALEPLVAVGAKHSVLGLVREAGNLVDEGGRALAGAAWLGQLGALVAEVDEADVVVEADLGAKLGAAALVVGPGCELWPRGRHVATYEAEAFVG